MTHAVSHTQTLSVGAVIFKLLQYNAWQVLAILLFTLPGSANPACSVVKPGCCVLEAQKSGQIKHYSCDHSDFQFQVWDLSLIRTLLLIWHTGDDYKQIFQRLDSLHEF